MASLKNQMNTSLTGSAMDDLYGNKIPGEGDALKQQTEDDENERRKKKQNAAGNSNPAAYGDMSLPPATSLLYGRANL